MPDVTFRLEAADRSVEASVHLPDEPLRPVELLPVILSLTNAVVAMSEARVEESGAKTSCCAGCGACCRQLVPISDIEARHLAWLVAAMPEERRARVVERFRAAVERSAEVLEAFHGTSGEAASQELVKAVDAYFKKGIACPFLEEESCSIHAERPAVCREYLVTSPAEHCARLDHSKIESVVIPVTVSSALTRFSDGRGTPEPRSMPLIEVLEWAAAHEGDPQPQLAAPRLFQNFMKLFLDEGAKEPRP